MRLADLREITAKLFDHLESRGVQLVDFDSDYYWAISRQGRIDMTNQPHDFTIGQLSDDLRELENIHRGDREILSYHLVWLASVLRELGETTPG